MSRAAPPNGETATWKGLVIIGGAVLLGLAVTRSFGNPTEAGSSTPQATDAPRIKGTTTSVTVAATTTTLTPLREPKEVKVLAANATATSGATKNVVDALKPACYSLPTAIDATAKVKAEKRQTTTVYSTPGYEREAAQITTRLGLQTTANAALPPELPVAATGVPIYNVLVLVGQDLVDRPPQPLPPCAGSTTSASSSTTVRGATTTTKRSTTTTAKATTTTKAATTSSRLTTTTT